VGSSGFEEWVRDDKHLYSTKATVLAEEAWNKQQAIIDEQKEKIARLEHGMSCTICRYRIICDKDSEKSE